MKSLLYLLVHILFFAVLVGEIAGITPPDVVSDIICIIFSTLNITILITLFFFWDEAIEAARKTRKKFTKANKAISWLNRCLVVGIATVLGYLGHPVAFCLIIAGLSVGVYMIQKAEEA